MKVALNLIIGSVVFWAVSRLFPGIIQTDGIKTLVVVMLILVVITGVADVIATIVVKVVGFHAWPVLFILPLFFVVITMVVLSNSKIDFTIIGFLPKVLLSIPFVLFDPTD